MRKTFKGGKAIFTIPPAPVKCAGAPQKIAYLCDDYWKNSLHKVNAEVHYFTPLASIFGVKYYSDALERIADQKGIKRHYNSVLVSVRKGVATFKDTTNNTTYEETYDFLHAVPLMSAPDALKGSPISNQAGFVEVGQDMRHKKYNNIWAIGDCVSLPNAKTAAAVFSQMPVLVHNLNNQILQQNKPTALYDGYSSCPLFVGGNKLLLAEFRDWNDKNGNPQKAIDESFHPGEQNIEKRHYYYITKIMIFCYRLGLKGYWYGKYCIFKPNFNGKFDTRRLYLPAMWTVSLLFFLFLFPLFLL
jgi:sulfide:quinone oxidoreductase